MHPHAVLHDRANLVALPIVVAAAIAGLLGGQSEQTLLVKVIFAYVGLDTVWVFLDDHAVPGALQAIRYHHVGTMVLIMFPMLRPELAWFACLDATTEINTFFLIARRQFKQHRAVLTACYWATFIPVRLVLFPALLFVFRDLPLPPWERAIIWTLQLGLCIFNLGMVHRSFSGWLRNRRAAETRKLAEQSETTALLPDDVKPAQQKGLAASQALPSVWHASATAHVTLTSRGKVNCSKVTGLFGTGNIRRRPSIHDQLASQTTVAAAAMQNLSPTEQPTQTTQDAALPQPQPQQQPEKQQQQLQQQQQDDWGAEDSVSCTGDSASSLGTPEQRARLAKLSDLGAIADLWGSSVPGPHRRGGVQKRAC